MFALREFLHVDGTIPVAVDAVKQHSKVCAHLATQTAAALALSHHLQQLIKVDPTARIYIKLSERCQDGRPRACSQNSTVGRFVQA